MEVSFLRRTKAIKIKELSSLFKLTQKKKLLHAGRKVVEQGKEEPRRATQTQTHHPLSFIFALLFVGSSSTTFYLQMQKTRHLRGKEIQSPNHT
jgi:hypothetical protein